MPPSFEMPEPVGLLVQIVPMYAYSKYQFCFNSSSYGAVYGFILGRLGRINTKWVSGFLPRDGRGIHAFCLDGIYSPATCV